MEDETEMATEPIADLDAALTPGQVEEMATAAPSTSRAARAAIASQPIPNAFLRRVRNASTLHSFDDVVRVMQSRRHVNDPQKIRDLVSQTVRKRLQAKNILTSDLEDSFFSFMLPKNNSTATDWEALLDSPLAVSTGRLRTMMNMRASTNRSAPAPPGHTVFYLRSFAFTRAQFLDVLQDAYEGNFGAGSYADRLCSAISDLDAPDQAPLFLRYIGKTTQGTAWVRHVHDLNHAFSSTQVILQACQRLYPEIMTAAEVYEFPDAELTFVLQDHHQRIADVREQALIALFGRETLLNTQVGGSQATFSLQKADELAFAKVETNLLEHFQACSECVSIDSIRRYARGCQTYARENPVTTGYSKLPLDDEFVAILAEQAKSCHINGYAPIVFIGSDLTDNLVVKKEWFFRGSGGASKIIMDIIDSLAYSEMGYRSTMVRPVATLRDNQNLPFVDLYPWVGKDGVDYSAATRLLRDYLCTTKPLVTFTLGFLVSSTAVGRFQHANSLREDYFYEDVGELHISRYDEDPSRTDSDNACIVVPSFHPGAARYASGKELDILLQIMGHTLVVAWVTTTVAIQAVKSGVLSDKRNLCDVVVHEARRVIGPGSEIYTRMQEAKQELLTLRKAARNTRVAKETAGKKKRRTLEVTYSGLSAKISSASIRWTKAVSELDMLIECGIARGRPGSDVRESQVEELLSVSIAAFSEGEVLRSKLLNAPTNDLLYFVARSTPELFLQDISNLISLFLDDDNDLEQGDWRQDVPSIRTGINSLTNWILKSVFHTTSLSKEETRRLGSQELQKLLQERDPELEKTMRRLQKERPTTPGFFTSNGQEIRIVARPYALHRDTLHLRWIHSGVTYEMSNFQLPNGCLPVMAGEKRFLLLHEKGLDILDSTGRALGTRATHSSTMSVTELVGMLQKNKHKDEFWTLWEQHTGHKLQDVLWKVPTTTGKIEVIPASFFRGRQTAFAGITHRKHGVKTMKETLPFEPGDAGWLINRFLHEAYPEGGDVWVYHSDDPVLSQLFTDNGCPSMLADLIS
jgi:hypothetical protein